MCQNISKEVLLTASKNQAKIQSRSEDTLFQNVTDIITNCDSYFITKRGKSLLQNATILLKNATVITKCVDFIKKCGVYYKIRQYSNSSLFSIMIEAHVMLTTSF